MNRTCNIVRLDGSQFSGSRINVRGTAGKTTLAKRLAKKTGLPYISLDEINWGPNFTPMDTEEFRLTVAQKLDSLECWIVDGHYQGDLREIVVERSDTVIVIHLPWSTMFWRLLKRTVRRAFSGEVLFNGNKHTFRNSFFSKQSLLWHHIKSRKRHENRLVGYRQWLRADGNAIELTTSKQLDDFYEKNDL